MKHQLLTLAAVGLVFPFPKSLCISPNLSAVQIEAGGAFDAAFSMGDSPLFTFQNIKLLSTDYAELCFTHDVSFNYRILYNHRKLEYNFIIYNIVRSN